MFMLWYTEERTDAQEAAFRRVINKEIGIVLGLVLVSILGLIFRGYYKDIAIPLVLTLILMGWLAYALLAQLDDVRLTSSMNFFSYFGAFVVIYALRSGHREGAYLGLYLFATICYAQLRYRQTFGLYGNRLAALLCLAGAGFALVSAALLP